MTQRSPQLVSLLKGGREITINEDDAEFVPHISHILDNYYLGGVPSEKTTLPSDFDVIVNLAGVDSYRDNFHHVPSISVVVDMVDSYQQDVAVIEPVVQLLASTEAPTLIHCAAGLNRSALVMARVLMVRYGWTGPDAIRYIRRKRVRFALFNQHFRASLTGLEIGVPDGF